MRRPRVILVMAIQFAGCQAGPPSGASVARTLLPSTTARLARRCWAGYPTTDTAVLALQEDLTYTLRIAVSASGAR